MEQSAVDKEHAEYCAKVDATPETVLCGHLDRIKADWDAYYIQCSDGTGDVCEGCMERTNGDELIYLPDAKESENIKGLEFDEDGAVHPYWDGESEYVEWVFLGTVAELKTLLKSRED